MCSDSEDSDEESFYDAADDDSDWVADEDKDDEDEGWGEDEKKVRNEFILAASCCRLASLVTHFTHTIALFQSWFCTALFRRGSMKLRNCFA